MSLRYAETRIEDALRQHGGNIAKARRQIIVWALEDDLLLLGLTRNHLDGIAGYHVERVASGRTQKPSTAAQPAPKIDVQAPAKPARKNEFGLEVLKAVAAKDPMIFGLETYSSAPARGQASARHVEAIHKLATRNIKKK